MAINRGLAPPQFPVPPTQYNPQYMAEVVRAFSVFLAQYQNPGDMRGTKLTLTALPESDVGLEPGALFQQDGYVKITLSNKPHPSGASGSSAVGGVTVTTT